VDPGVLPYVNVKRKDEVIIVDWSWQTFAFIDIHTPSAFSMEYTEAQIHV
jgi:hypothetical protein